MDKRISLKLAFLFCILLLATTSTAGGAAAQTRVKEEIMKNNDSTATESVVPDSDDDYCLRVVCKGLNCGKVYSADGRCWCVLKQGPLVTLPCTN
ncbi:unnamed protein product [Linum trigynum]|uniref:Uncharacterized protein n=1 Tax=Linum trigynum TaxID=586398 RepID=A0AAV2E8N4_9ROSI